MKTIGGGVTALAVAAVLIATARTPSGAAATKPVYASTHAFDGLWSVSIVTRQGPCPASYRYPARIVGGRVVQADNDGSYQIAGRVSGSGAIAVRVSSGGQSAVGYGRMSRSQGGGWWRADGGECVGTWSAVRRG